MKIVKYVFLLLLLAVIAVTVFIATQEGKYDIKKERIIKVPKAVLYNYINEYKNWENVGILTNSDTTTVYIYSENSAGEGAQMTWKKDDNNGKIQTVKLVENDSIMQNAVIDNLNSEILWAFKDTLNSTKVTLRVKGHLSFTEKANALLKGGSNEKIEASLEKGLDNLNTFLVHELNVFNVEVKGLVTKTGTFYLGHSTSSKITDINKKAAEIFGKLLDFTNTNKIIMNGSPFILYKTFDKANGNAAYMVCVPIKEEIFTSPGSEFEGGKLLPFTALKTTLKGDYSHLSRVWDTAFKHITDKGLQENTTGQYLEIYSKGIQKTKKPSEWITDIYIPIGQPTVTPVPVTTDVLPGSALPTTTGVRPTATTNTTKPAATVPGAAVKPATSKPVGSATTTPGTTKPAANKPIVPAVTKLSATTTAKPAATKPVTATNKPAAQPTTTP